MRITGPTDLHFLALQRMMATAPVRAPGQAVEPVVPATPAPALVQSQASVAMLLAIAACDPEGHRRMLADVDKGLKGLERLHRQRLAGAATAADLAAIAAWMNDHGVPDDPAAAALLREVELRVLVELAKAERDVA